MQDSASPTPSKQPIVPQSITDRNGQILALLRNTIKGLDWIECGYDRFFYLFQESNTKAAFCLFCGAYITSDLAKLGEHVFECSAASSPLAPFRQWLHEGTDPEENARVLSLLRKSLFLHFWSAHYFSNLMKISSRYRVNDHSKTIFRLLGVPYPNWETDPNPLVSLDLPLTQHVWSLLKSAKGVYVVPHCLHNKYNKPEGLLMLAMDLSGALYAISHSVYQKGRSVPLQAQNATHAAILTLRDEGVPVLGFISTADMCTNDCVAQLKSLYPEEMAELVEIVSVRRIKEDWMGVVSRDAEFRALVEPVLKIVDVMASTPLYRDTLTKAAHANKVEDFVLCQRAELCEDNFYKQWFACGVSFFQYMSIFKNMQAYMKTNKARFREPNPEGFDYYISVDIRPDTRAFTVARDTLRLMMAHQSFIKMWRAQQEKKNPVPIAQLAARELGALQLPPTLVAKLAECFCREVENESWGFVPVQEDVAALLHYVCYQGEQGFASAPSEQTKNALREMIPAKARRRAVVKEFEAFASSFTELAEVGFGKLPATTFWEGEGIKRFPRFGKIALRLSLTPSHLDVANSINILRTYANNQFQSFYGDPEAVVKVQNVVNMSSVDYYSLCDEKSCPL